MATWSAPVRYAEVDQQGIAFNAHYLTWCDEACSAYFLQRGLTGFADRVHLVASTLHWSAPSRWGDVIEVDAACTRLGNTSFTMTFAITASGRPVCTVETTYVATDPPGVPLRLSDEVRAALS